MGKIYKSIAELVGHTPLVELTNYEAKYKLNANILGKLEYFNPSGSVKDRAALRMIEEAEKSGDLKPGQTIVDNTSGNTGIALAAFAHAKGHEFVTFLEPGVSKEREDIFKAYGVEQFWFTDISDEVTESLKRGEIEVPTIEKGVSAFAEKNGYYYTTGPEIWEDTDGKVDIVVMLAGTAGTLSGLSKFFKEKDTFDIEDFANEVIEQPEVIDSFHNFKRNYESENDIVIDDSFAISNYAFKKQQRSYKRIINLDKKIQIIINGNRQNVEQGEDERGKFYKVYYSEEA